MSTILRTESKLKKRRRSSKRLPRRAQSADDSETSSLSSSRSEVRCACQFFQSEELLPEYRKNPIGSFPLIPLPNASPNRMSPLIFNHQQPPVFADPGDHEYEPIDAPNEARGLGYIKPQVPIVQLKEVEELPKIEDDAASITSTEQKFLRIPMDDELVVPEDGQSEDAAMSEGDINVDDRFFNATPTTIGSRTDGEFNTSQVDSSALESLPLKRENRKHATLASEENMQSQNFGQRVKQSASRLKTKLKGIKRPTRAPKEPKLKVERVKKDGLLARARKIERPKFSMPKMPDLPKMPDRPRLSLPKIPDIPRPKLPDLSKKMPDLPRPKLPDISLPSFGPKMPSFAAKTEKNDDEPVGKKKRFDFDFRTYPKILNRRKKQAAATTTGSSESSPRSSIPDWVTMPRKKGPVGQRWAKKFKDITYADDESKPKEASTKTTAPIKTDDPMVFYIPLRDYSREEPEEDQEIDQNNILSHDEVFDEPVVPKPRAKSIEKEFRPVSNERAASAERGGVIEEINADEFFVREKGISQDNINVSLYLSSEIREAFQHPINALSQMLEGNGGYYEYDKVAIDEDYSKMRDSPLPIEEPPVKTLRKKKRPSMDQSEPPSRPSRSRKGSILSSLEDIQPPSRPTRSRKSSAASSIEDINKPYRPPRTRSGPSSREISIENIHQKHRTLSSPSSREMSAENIHHVPRQFKSGPTSREVSIEDIHRPQRPNRSRKGSLVSSRGVSVENVNRFEANTEDYRTFPPPRPMRSRKGSIASKKNDQVVENGVPPAPTRRKKSLRSSKSLNISEQLVNEGIFQGDDQMVSLQEIRSNFVREEIPPVPKRRSRTSLASRSTIHTIDDDRTSHGADSLSEDRFLDHPVPQPHSRKSATPPGYARVEKYKEVRVPPPRRKRKTQFFTVPRRLRDEDSLPNRNYNSLRRPEDKENEGYIEIEDKLQSGEVIQKMKSRPLPAPPRPPRHKVLREQNRLLTTEDKNDLAKASNESIVKGTLLIGSHGNIVTEERVITPIFDQVMNLRNLRQSTPEIHINDEIVEKSDEGNEKGDLPEKFEEGVIEVETSTQTDPLPDDFCCEEVVAEPTDIILIPSKRKTISEELTPDLPAQIEAYNQEMRVASPVLPARRIETFDEELRISPMLPARRAISEQVSFESQGSCDTPMSNPDDPLDQYLKEMSTKRGILEQQSHERLSESPAERYEDSHLKESMVRLARSEQSSLISRPLPVQETPQPQIVAPIMPQTLKVERLQVGDLDVSRLTVSELMAQKILVSEIDGMSLKLHDISSETGSLSTEDIKLPPNFIEEIVNRLQSRSASEQPSERHVIHYREESTNTDDNFSPRPSSSLSQTPTPDQLSRASPYPHIYVLPPSFYQPTPSVSFSTPTPDPPVPILNVPDPSIPDLSAQLLRACHTSLTTTFRQVLLELSSRLNSGDQKRDANVAVMVLVVLVAALMLLGYTATRGDAIHHHHWEYFNPPSGDKPI